MMADVQNGLISRIFSVFWSSFLYRTTLMQGVIPNRCFGIRDFAYLKARIRDLEGKGGRDSGLCL